MRCSPMRIAAFGGGSRRWICPVPRCAATRCYATQTATSPRHGGRRSRLGCGRARARAGRNSTNWSAFAPGIHYFVPVDIDDRQGGFRAFFFFCGLGWTRDVVAAEASGITDTTTVGAGRISASPDFVSSERFAYLDGSVIDGAPLFYDGRLSLVFCRELVERLGDVLPRNQAFVPMGVAQGER